MIELTGISWDHPRGRDPLVHTTELYAALHPGVRITWDTRSLQALADSPVERLAQRYDLIVIDHPFVGRAAALDCFHALDTLIERAVLADLARHSVGFSYASYEWAGHQWALPVDAAAHVSAARLDLLDRLDKPVPERWEDVLELGASARRAGLWLVVPLIPVDALMSLLSVIASLGAPALARGKEPFDPIAGAEAIRLLKAILVLTHPGSRNWNPPGALEAMSRSDEIVYCPLLFGYSNYARPGFRAHQITFGPMPDGLVGGRGGILGGTGLAISAASRSPAEAAEYAAWTASGAIQAGPYFAAGGQPGHRSAWTDPSVNESSAGFFERTLAGLDAAYVRPRWNGYLRFQEAAGAIVRNALLGELDEDQCIADLNRLADSAAR